MKSMLKVLEGLIWIATAALTVHGFAALNLIANSEQVLSWLGNAEQALAWFGAAELALTAKNRKMTEIILGLAEL